MHCGQKNLEMQKELVFTGFKVPILYPVCHLDRIPNKTVLSNLRIVLDPRKIANLQDNNDTIQIHCLALADPLPTSNLYNRAFCTM